MAAQLNHPLRPHNGQPRMCTRRLRAMCPPRCMVWDSCIRLKQRRDRREGVSLNKEQGRRAAMETKAASAEYSLVSCLSLRVEETSLPRPGKWADPDSGTSLSTTTTTIWPTLASYLIIRIKHRTVGRAVIIVRRCVRLRHIVHVNLTSSRTTSSPATSTSCQPDTESCYYV